MTRPKVLQDALVEVFNGTGTEQQRRLVNNYCDSLLYEADWEELDWLIFGKGE